MKGWMLAAGATVALVASLTASAAVPDQKTERLPARQAIYQSWSLSDQQQEQLTSANKVFHERMTTLKNQSFDSSRARHQAIKETVQTHRQALSEVLDDEQLKVLEGLDQRAAPMRAKGELIAALLDSWQLDDAQKQAIGEARQQMRQDLGALRQDKSATDSREDRRQNMEKIREEQQARLSRILSAEQIRVLEMMRHVELRGPKGKPPTDVRRALVESWHLDASQLDAMTSATKELHQKMAQLHGKDALEQRERRQQMGSAKKAFHQSLENILSPTQLAALDSISAHDRPKMGPPTHGEGKGMPSQDKASAHRDH